MEANKAAKLFEHYLKAMPSNLAEQVVLTVDTAKALKLGCREAGLDISDGELLKLSIELIKS